jgi:PrcB C-terminal
VNVFAIALLPLIVGQASGVPMRTIDQGTQSRVEAARTVVVSSEEEWTKLWRAHAPDKPLPPVDFSRDMVVGVFLGTKPTAGYGVEIVGTREEPIDSFVVQYRVASPPLDAMTAQIITTPYHLAAVPKRAGEVKFEKIR